MIVLQLPGGEILCLFMFSRDPIARGNIHPWSTSLLIDLSSADEFIPERDDVWSPLSNITSRSDFLVSSYIGSK